MNAIPEFETTRPQPKESDNLDLTKVLAEVRHLKALVDQLMPVEDPLPYRHHPDCAECCAWGRCHWCLSKPETGTITSTGPDGFIYSACRAHLTYFAEMQRRASPSAGLDLRAGLEHLEIATPSPLTR